MEIVQFWVFDPQSFVRKMLMYHEKLLTCQISHHQLDQNKKELKVN